MRHYRIYAVILILVTFFILGAASAHENVSSDSLTVEEFDDSNLEIANFEEENLNSEVGQTLIDGKNSEMSVDFVTQDSDNEIYKIDENTDIMADSYNQDYLRVNFPEQVGGNLSLYIDNEYKASKDITGKTHYLFANDKNYNLTPGTHAWLVKYSGDDNYASKSVNGTFTLNIKDDVTLNISFVRQDDSGRIYEIDENADIYVNDHDSDYIRIKLPTQISGTLSLYIDKKFASEKQITGKTHYLFMNSRSYKLSEGNHTWKIRYSGDDEYKPQIINGTFTLNPPSDSFVKKNSKMQVYIVSQDQTDKSIYLIDAEKEIGEDTKGQDYFKIKFPKQVSGTLSLYIDGKLKAEKKISKKTHYMYANIESYNLKQGTHEWEIKYSGDDEYNSTSVSGTFTLNKISKKIKPSKVVTLTVSKSKKYKPKTTVKKYSATLKSNKKLVKNVYVYLTITGKKFKKTFSAKTNAKGVATFKIKGLTKKGTYSAKINFKGNKNYPPVSNTLKIKITKTKCTITAKKPSVTHKTKPVYGQITNTSYNGFIDVTEAYDLLDSFRAEKGVWHFNKDDTGKVYYNTNAANTLKTLERSTVFEEVAQVRAMELIELYSHTRPDGKDTWTAYPNETDGYFPTGENIAKGHYFFNCKDITELWKESNEKTYNDQGHRVNMLNPNSDYVGIAAYKLDNIVYWVQSFGMDWDY